MVPVVVIFISIVLFWSGQAFAQVEGVITPLRDISELADQGPVTEEVMRLSNVRVMIADYDLIRQDFPQVSSLSNPEIDQWLIEQAGHIAGPQASQTVVNNTIPVNSQTREALRPQQYGRALVYPVEGGGLIDVKGAGALKPLQSSHRNGLATLGECLREYLYENAVRKLLQQENALSRTVGSYAVLSTGFDVIHADGSDSPAGLYLRQAHSRFHSHQISGPIRDRIREVLLIRGISVDRNLQGTRDGNIFDFGHYLTTPVGEVNAYDQVVGGRPYPRLPTHLWGYENVADSKMDRPFIWSHDIAQRFVRGEASRDDVWAFYRNMMDPVTQLEFGEFSEEVISRYIALLGDPSATIEDRLRVIHLLINSRVSTERQIQVFIQSLVNDPAPRVRISAAHALSEHIETYSVKMSLLDALLNDSDRNVRGVIASVISNNSFDAEVKNFLLNILEEQPKRFDESLEPFILLRNHRDDLEIRRAITFLLVNGTVDSRKFSAVLLISQIDDPSFIRFVKDLFKRPGELPSVVPLRARQFFLKTLSEINETGPMPVAYQRLIASSIGVEEVHDIARNLIIRGDDFFLTDQTAREIFRSRVVNIPEDRELIATLYRRQRVRIECNQTRSITNALRSLRDRMMTDFMH